MSNGNAPQSHFLLDVISFTSIRFAPEPFIEVPYSAPKAEFEKNPLGVVTTLPATSDSSQYGHLPTDWTTYDRDMKEILACVASQCREFKMPPSMLPSTGKQTPFIVRQEGCDSELHFVQIDHGMSFKPFFPGEMCATDAQKRERLLQTSALCEPLRCFFIHLGVALGLHPIALQAQFCTHSAILLACIEHALSQKTSEDDQRFDELKLREGSLRSVLRHNDMIEAPVLSILWPPELQVPEFSNVLLCKGCYPLTVR